MTDKKISELTSITGANVSDANDVLPIVDTSVATTKKITRAELFKSVSSVDINGGTIDGTVIGGSTPAAISGTTGTFSGNLTVDTNTLFVDAANNRVGIGTSSPAHKLDVASGDFRLYGSGASADLRLTSTGNDAIINAAGTGLASLALQTSGTERLRIDSSGKLSLSSNGDFSALDGVFGLQVGNSAIASSGVAFATANRGYVWYIPSGGTSLSLWDSTANSNRLTIDSSGNVGIGTSIPGSKLSIVGLPTSSAGLSSGDVWNDGGTLKIV